MISEDIKQMVRSGGLRIRYEKVSSSQVLCLSCAGIYDRQGQHRTIKGRRWIENCRQCMAAHKEARGK